MFFKLATFREKLLSSSGKCFGGWNRVYVFSDLCGHIRKFLAGFGIADPNGLCLVNFGGCFLFEFFHHVWPLLLVARCQGACRRFHWCNFLFWWSELFLWFFLLLCLARDLRSYFLSSWSHAWISSSGLAVSYRLVSAFRTADICSPILVWYALFDSPMYTASQSLQSSL